MKFPLLLRVDKHFSHKPDFLPAKWNSTFWLYFFLPSNREFPYRITSHRNKTELTNISRNQSSWPAFPEPIYAWGWRSFRGRGISVYGCSKRARRRTVHSIEAVPVPRRYDEYGDRFLYSIYARLLIAWRNEPRCSRIASGRGLFFGRDVRDPRESRWTLLISRLIALLRWLWT